MNVVPVRPPGPRADVADQLALAAADLRASGETDWAGVVIQLAAVIRDNSVSSALLLEIEAKRLLLGTPGRIEGPLERALARLSCEPSDPGTSASTRPLSHAACAHSQSANALQTHGNTHAAPPS
jgi:hypothetical protein